jgi:hypothetical protein
MLIVESRDEEENREDKSKKDISSFTPKQYQYGSPNRWGFKKRSGSISN